MDVAGVDHLLLTGADHIRYATDFRAQLTNEPDWFAAVVDRQGEAEVFVPYIDEVIDDPLPELGHVKRMHPLPSWAPAVSHPRSWASSVARALRARGARVVGHDSIDTTSLNGLRRELPELKLLPVTRELFECRRFKHAIEVELLEAASRVNTGAMRAALGTADVDRTDHDILAAAMQYQQSAGAEFVTHSVCNIGKASGDWYAIGNRLRRGEPFFFDIGCYGHGGYASDAARTGFVGEPRTTVLTAYEHLLEAQRVGQEATRPGVKVSMIQIAVNEYIEAHGYRRTPYGVGHGVGLRICELPTVSRADLIDKDLTVGVGDVLSLEPELTVEVDSRPVVLKVEDNFAVEATGLRALTVPPALEEVVVRD